MPPLHRWIPLLALSMLLVLLVLWSPFGEESSSLGDGGVTAEDPPPVPRKKTSGAMQALDLWAAQRAYPGAVIPDVGFAAAFGRTQVMKTATYEGPFEDPVDASIPPWTPLGPTNIGGRTLALALHPDHPDTMFAGSASGGLWKSTTGGVGATAWHWVDTGFPVLAVGAIAIDSRNPLVMYVGTGEVYRYQNSVGGDVNRTTRGSYGIGILKSIDGGITWTHSLDWTYQQSRGVWNIRIHPDDSSIVYAATTEGVFKSVDAGGSWISVHDVIMATDLRIHPTNPDTVYVACGNFGSPGHGMYRTYNGGSTWTRLTTGLPASWTGKAMFDIAPTAPHILYASVANTLAGFGLYKSFNNGDTWSRIKTTDFQLWQGWYSHWVLVSPNSVNRLFVGGINIWKSEDGGNTLTEVSDWEQAFFGTPPPEGPGGGPQWAHADHHFAVWHPQDLNTIFFASDGGVFKTTDGGNTFVGLNGGYSTSQFYQGFSQSATDSNLAMGGMQDNFTAIYEGGPAWRRAIGGDGSWTAVNTENDQTLYGSAQVLQMFRSRNGGADWTEITPPTQSGDVTAFIAPFVLAPSEPTRIYGGRSRVYRSDNEGDSWIGTNGGSRLDGNNPVFTLAVSATNPDLVFAATAPNSSRGRIFRTENGGTTWTDITGPLPDRYPSDIAIDPTWDQNVVVTFMGFGTSHVFRSTNRGDTWIDIGEGLPDIPVSSVIMDPDKPQVLYVGTDLGVYVSPFKGLSWYPFMNGMPTAMVNDLQIFGPGGKLRAATHGSGVFERELLNLAITEIPGDLPRRSANALGLRVAPHPLAADSRVFFTLEEAGPVRLSLFDVQGRRLGVLLDETRPPGEHSVPLNAGRWGRYPGVSQGIYFLRLQAGTATAITRVVWLR